MAASEPVVVVEPPRYVGRGGVKLEHALDRFGIDPRDRTAIDIGASTGGFTDCLLQRAVASVVAVDVGTHQLHESLRADPRVESLERTDVRSLDDRLSAERQAFDLVVVDLSFISTTRLLGHLERLLAADGDLVVLVKPQFEAGRTDVRRAAGVVRDPTVWRRVLHEFIDATTEAGLVVVDLALSPITGAKGNVEFLAHIRRPDILGE